MDRRRNGARVWDFQTVVPRTACGSQACRFSIRWKAFLGSCPSCFHRQVEARVLTFERLTSLGLTCRSTPPSVRKDVKSGQHIGRFGFRLGCACG